LGINAAWPIDELDQLMPGLLAGRRKIYLSLSRSSGLDQQVTDWIHASRALPAAIGKPVSGLCDVDLLLHEQRLIKSPAEQRILRRAARITATAHERAMRSARPGQFEYQLESELLHEFMQGGARFPAYNSIVGSGRNGCILHYVENNAVMADGDLVLVDAGCELEHYAADVTRTFPVNGRFSEAQKALYELVLQAQRAAIRAIAPGKRFNAPNDAAIRIITRGLLQLGLLKGELKQLIRTGAYRRFYMHSTSHWLGMDVHDVGSYREQGKWRVLKPGMVLTVEPGIYVAADLSSVASKWRGIGIRIEDDVLVTETGCEVLSEGAPKSVDEIESLMAAALQ
jgi:Xaa-Pro aminopeptidase